MRFEIPKPGIDLLNFSPRTERAIRVSRSPKACIESCSTWFRWKSARLTSPRFFQSNSTRRITIPRLRLHFFCLFLQNLNLKTMKRTSILLIFTATFSKRNMLIWKFQLGLKEVRRYKWVPFVNEARSDGLQLHHWQRVDRIDPTQPYPFARFNTAISIFLTLKIYLNFAGHKSSRLHGWRVRQTLEIGEVESERNEIFVRSLQTIWYPVREFEREDCFL